jgi:hypothetical protein
MGVTTSPQPVKCFQRANRKVAVASLQVSWRNGRSRMMKDQQAAEQNETILKSMNAPTIRQESMVPLLRTGLSGGWVRQSATFSGSPTASYDSQMWSSTASSLWKMLGG